jgi:hypothetical protein
MTKSRPSVTTKPGEKAYQHLWQRVIADVDNFEQWLEQEWQHDLTEAANIDAELREMSGEEWSLMAAYVKRDITSLGRFLLNSGKGVAKWLGFEPELLEQSLLERLQQLADKAELERSQWQRHLAHDESLVYRQGQWAAPGTLRCCACHHSLQLTEISQLPSCPHCGHPYFQRLLDGETKV